MADYVEFWREFLRRAESIVPLYHGVIPKNKSYLHTKKGDYKHFCTAFNTKKKEIWIENCIQETGQGGEEESNRKFDYLYEQRKNIEQHFGEQLKWERLPEKKRSRIISQPIYFDYNDRSSWNEIFNKLQDKMNRFIPAMERAALGINSLHPTTVRRKRGNKKSQQLPDKKDAELAARQVANRTPEAILNQIERNFMSEGKVLGEGWREKTRKNIIAEWFR